VSTAVPPPLLAFGLWERFQAGICPADEVSHSRLLQRWQRCRIAGLSADSPGEPIMAPAKLEESRDRFAPFLAPGAPFDAFASALAEAGFSGLFCDADGVIVSRRIAEPFENAVARAKLVEGAVWSEAARGTNGMGTALVEKAPVAVVGAEHYEQRNHQLACYGAPVRDIHERVVAVLDASGLASDSASFVQASVVATAAAIEALIVARTYDAAVPGGLFELERLLAGMPHAALVVEATGHVRRANTRFRALAESAGPFDAGRVVRALLAAGPAWIGARRALPAPIRGVTLELEPIGPPQDPFAALVHLRPRGRSRAGGERPVPEAFAPIIGSDPTIAAAREQAARFAQSDLPVLVLAETGAGKELFARAIHVASGRSGPFVAVNCGALTGTLLESELFGYGSGAFTGAAAGGRTGKLAAANGGTLFLDEAGELSPSAQAMLLRFLEDGTYYRVGEASERHADVRLIAATSRDLPALVARQQFRSDLYFRMRGVVLRLPPLRERDDRGELARVLLQRIARQRVLLKPLGLSRAALAWIEKHDWPGNVRELRSALDYAVVLAGDAPRVELWHLPIEENTPSPALGELRVRAERAAVVRALSEGRGNLSVAARSLGVARSTLYRMLGRHGLRSAAESGES
jgi:sigma-54 dependent transcriptional regulator, acetoin dehydrogenase operon transcriptional activator AcoR